MENMLTQAICRILRPLLRILHRKGVAFGEFSQLAKQIYVEVSEDVLAATGERPTTSRIAIATGLVRRCQEARAPALPHRDRQSVAAR